MAETPITGYFPLVGARFDSEDWGAIGEVIATVPHYPEWQRIQKTDVWWARFETQPSLEGPRPPLCLHAFYNPDPDQDWLDNLETIENFLEEKAYDAVSALRLWKSGWFMSPWLTEQTFTDGMINQRRVGPYRQACVDLRTPDGMTEYTLEHEEMLTEADMKSEGSSDKPLNDVWHLLVRYRTTAAQSSTDLALDNFHRAYGYQIPYRYRAAYLFTGLDVLLGGMNAREIADVRLRSKFELRVETALEAAGFELPSELAAWLNGEGRRIRNTIAHGRSQEVEEAAGANYTRLEDILRSLLLQYVRFCIAWADDPPSSATLLELSETVSPVAAYNRLLERVAHGDTAMAEFLDRPPSE